MPRPIQNKVHLLDYGGVLTHDYVETNFVSELATKFGVKRDALTNVLKSNQLLQTLSLGQTNEFDAVNTVCQNLPHARRIPASDFMADSFSPHPEALDLVDQLRASARVGLVSNIFPAGAVYLRGLGFGDRFDRLFLSCELGVRKPDPAIYHHVVAALGTSPTDCFFYDDSDANVSAARDTGINAIKVAGFEELREAVASTKSEGENVR